MLDEDPGCITRLLAAAHEGDPSAHHELISMVYGTLKQLAIGCIDGDHPSLTSTELVHEAYLRLAGSEASWENRRHFYGAAAEAMRRILVDRARARHAAKRGGGLERLPLEALNTPDACSTSGPDLLLLDEALRQFESVDQRAARVVMLRFFAGLDVEHAAKVLGVSPATVKRDWAYAKAWLYEQITSI